MMDTRIIGAVDRIHIERSYAGQRTDVYVLGRSTNEINPRPMILLPQELVELKPDDSPKPTFSVDARMDQRESVLQGLVDGLYAMGLRPTPGKFAGVADDAQASHLADMRRLVFDSNFINWKRLT